MTTHSGSTLVVKLGTSVLTQGTRSLNQAHMMEIVRQCAAARQQGHRIIIVTSGAIAAGREHLGHPVLPQTVACKQLLAAVGQSRLIRVWENLFGIYGLHVGQMLLTRADLEDRERFLNARDTLRALLEHGIVPVINENDAVVTSEIRVGDNDTLSALAAVLAGADALVLLTDQEGLFTADPRNNPSAQLIPEVPAITEDIYRLAGGSVSGLGTGGMITKIQAAEIATQAGIPVVIAPGANAKVIPAVLAGQSVGTRFLPCKNPLESRKLWLFGPPAAGSLHIDAGASKALLERGSSLLPKGITGVGGTFARGEVVRILSPHGADIAHGVACYNSDDMQRIKGLHSEGIAAVLGYDYGPVAIHRDDCIIRSRNAADTENL
ncbi:glutamate 5-kinase [Desulfovibrio cuneatus]|uniref:glutamate 5-kinase n=1 Tax=Desulfovibrio cuneatus TaxID=159728 RepID=UPI0003F843C2|nr:glutamate 5-kinase [Desulfovibrio cuneatus]